jgi:hypothetical protein
MHRLGAGEVWGWIQGDLNREDCWCWHKRSAVAGGYRIRGFNFLVLRVSNRSVTYGFLIYLFDCDPNVENASFAFRDGGSLAYMVCLNVNRLKHVLL